MMRSSPPSFPHYLKPLPPFPEVCLNGSLYLLQIPFQDPGSGSNFHSLPAFHDDYESDLFNSRKLAEANVEDNMIKRQIQKDIRKLISQLPEDQREVVILRHYSGLSFKEIADLTDVSINTALGRMRYALINMRKMMEEKKITLTFN